MLILINPFDSMFTGEDVSNRVLTKGYNYHILDTTDLVVETVSYEQLRYIVCKDGVRISNICVSDGVMKLPAVHWCHALLNSDVFMYHNRIVKHGNEFSLDGEGIRIDVSYFITVEDSVTKFVCRLKLDREVIYTWYENTIVTSCDFALFYIYKLKEYIVVRLRVTLNSTVSRVLALILDDKGGLVDVAPYFSMPSSTCKSKDALFSAKFKSLINKLY